MPSRLTEPCFKIKNVDGLNNGRKSYKMYRQIEWILWGDRLKQIIQLDNELREKIKSFEKESEKICWVLKQKYESEFEKLGQHLVIELIRVQSGKSALKIDVLEDNYESFIEIGIEQGKEYYPNGYIPIWKVKNDWFQKMGYLTDHNVDEIQSNIGRIVEEMLEDR
ncbi:hypothetical protein ACF5W4_10545 [Bacillota bacterium Lsc_1132]